MDSNGRNCSDIDECLLGTDDCDTYATCANTDGGYTCTCNAGKFLLDTQIFFIKLQLQEILSIFTTLQRTLMELKIKLVRNFVDILCIIVTEQWLRPQLFL